jgi:hypothetical protein
VARAQALSLDGNNWAIQYSLAEDKCMRAKQSVAGLSQNYSLVATIELRQ